MRSTTTSTPSKSRQVTVEAALVEVELVDQAGAAAGLDTDAQAEVVTALLLEQALDLRGGDVREDDTVGGGLGLHLGGRSVRLDTHVLVLHVVERGSGTRTHARAGCVPGPFRIRRPPPIRASAHRRAPGGPGRPRPGDPGRARRERAHGVGERVGHLLRALGDGIHPRRPAVIASRRPTSDCPGMAMAGSRGARPPRRPDDDLAAQRLPVEAALPGDDEVGGGERRGRNRRRRAPPRRPTPDGPRAGAGRSRDRRRPRRRARAPA